MADDTLPKLLGTTTHTSGPAIVERVRALAGANSTSAVVAALRAMMTRPDSTGLLPSIAVPALVVVGEEDTLTPPSLSSAMWR